MSRFWLVLAAALLLGGGVSAQEDGEKKPAAITAAQAKENQNDAKQLHAYFLQEFRAIQAQHGSDPVAAEQALDALEKVVAGLEPENAEAKTVVGRATAAVKSLREMFALDKISFAEAEKTFRENPNDAKTISTYLAKLRSELAPIAMSKPQEAQARLDAATALIVASKDKLEDEQAKAALDNGQRLLKSLEDRIADGLRIAELIGKDAAPLPENIAWVNGEALASDDLKGKVVLLDFWAVWCGPCIATFPHLREWQEKYADKGLVIIGVTNYYNYTWNEEAQRGERSQDEVSPAAEHEMLKKFAAHHQLAHRFLVSKERDLASYYAVSGIPHAVVIDQQGKIRLIRVGSGPANAAEIGGLIAQLLGDAKKAP